jgi:hypothetical protein
LWCGFFFHSTKSASIFLLKYSILIHYILFRRLIYGMFVKIKRNNRAFFDKIKRNNCPFFVKIKRNRF